MVCGVALALIVAPHAWAQGSIKPLAATEPGPLDGGESGDIYRGPGFSFGLLDRWKIELDDLPPGLRGERGTARGISAHTDPAADPSIRFEPFPLEPGGRATLAEFERHIRETLASGRPVGVLPLIPTGSRGLIPCGNEPEGITLLFTRPGPDGTERSQRRYFVHAYPRLDGRLQTLIASHLGPADSGLSIRLMAVAGELASMWPDTGSTYRNATTGVVLPLPRGWRQCSLFGICGNSYMDEEAIPHQFMPHAVFSIVDHSLKIPGYESRPRVDLEVMMDLNRSLGVVMDSLLDAGANAQEFVFDDGEVGRISESDHFITIVRQKKTRFAKLSVLNPRPEDRQRVRTLARGLQLIAIGSPESPTGQPKQFVARGVSMTYPGKWTFSPHFQTPQARPGILAGSFGPIITSVGRAARQSAQERPELLFELVRLDDVLADHRRMAGWQLPEKQRERDKTVFTYEDQPFTTDSGWTGWYWVMASHSARGPYGTRNIQYVLPMPDGVLALQLSGMISENRANAGTGAPVEAAWKKIAASARIAQPAASPASKTQHAFQ